MSATITDYRAFIASKGTATAEQQSGSLLELLDDGDAEPA